METGERRPFSVYMTQETVLGMGKVAGFDALSMVRL